MGPPEKICHGPSEFSRRPWVICGDINEDWRNWKDTFLATVSDYNDIPSTKLRSRSYVPWMNSAIMHRIKKKNSVRRELRKSPTSINLREKFKYLRTAIKEMLCESRSK